MTWVRSANGFWHIERAEGIAGPWSSAACGRTLQPTQRHEGDVAPAAECRRCLATQNSGSYLTGQSVLVVGVEDDPEPGLLRVYIGARYNGTYVWAIRHDMVGYDDGGCVIVAFDQRWLNDDFRKVMAEAIPAGEARRRERGA